MPVLTDKEFEQNFKLHYKPLCLFAIRYTGDQMNAEDIVQQAFADVWEKIQGGTIIENLKAYLYRAVRNRSLTFVSNSYDTTTTDEFPEIEDMSEEERIHCAERDARLWEAIDRLPSKRKNIFLLSKRDGLKYQEIARELNLSVKTVENQMGKALKTLRETAIRIYTFFFG